MRDEQVFLAKHFFIFNSEYWSVFIINVIELFYIDKKSCYVSLMQIMNDCL